MYIHIYIYIYIIFFPNSESSGFQSLGPGSGDTKMHAPKNRNSPGRFPEPCCNLPGKSFVGNLLELSWNLPETCLDLCWNPTVTMLELLVSRVGLVGRDSVLNLISVEWALLHVFPLWLRCLVVLLSPLCFWARRQVLEFHCFIFVLLFA